MVVRVQQCAGVEGGTEEDLGTLHEGSLQMVISEYVRDTFCFTLLHEGRILKTSST